MKKIFSFIIGLVIILSLNSCTVGNFFKKGFEDFTTYFNIYYNASRLFNEAEEELLKQQKEIFTTKVIAPSGHITNKFIQVIEKCSKILQFRQNSSFVDDALIMIGKSYYYQREYPSAIRKFTELISNFPKSRYYLESQLWIARSYAQTVEVDRSLRLLNDVYLEARDKRNRQIMSDALIEILKIYFKRNDYEGIINIGSEFVKISRDKNAVAQVYLLMGNAYAKINQLDKAVESFSQVNKYTTDYYFRFKSQLELSKILREQKAFDESRKILDDLYSEALYDEYKDFIELEYAYLSLAKNDTSTALNYFIKVDTSYSTRETGGIAQFEIANYLENAVGNLDSAKFYYDKSLRAQISEDLRRAAQFKSQLLARYKNIWSSIVSYEKQIQNLRTFPQDASYQKFQEIEIDSSMLNDPDYLADIQEYLEEKRKADSIYLAKLREDSLRYQINLKNADSLEVIVARLKFDLATFFIIDYDKPDSAYVHLKYVVDKFPNKDFSERALYALANYYELRDEKDKADSLFRLIYDNFADSEISKIVAKRLGLKPKITQSDLPEIDYQEAENLVEQKKYEEAIKKLYLIYEKYQNTDYAPKSLLMIGHIYENNLKMYDSAYSVYKSLKEKYPASLFAQRINFKLIAYEAEMQRKEMERRAVEDSLNQHQLKKEQDNLPFDNPELIKDDYYKFDELKKEENTIPDSLIKREEQPNFKRK